MHLNKRPKRCSSSDIVRLFAKHMAIWTPESALWLAVIKQAVVDALEGTGIDRRGAIYFFLYRRHEIICDMIGLDSEWVREIVRDYGGLDI